MPRADMHGSTLAVLAGRATTRTVETKTYEAVLSGVSLVSRAGLLLSVDHMEQL
jgi:hypothetical protein